MTKRKKAKTKKKKKNEITRREFLKKAAIGGAAAAVAFTYAKSHLLSPITENIIPIDSGVDAKHRKKAYDYVKLQDMVECTLCPRACQLAEGERGKCRVRENVGGDLFSFAYGNPCSRHIDPVEKKPLLHFLPGTTAYSIATAGCNVRCLNCQNWTISQKAPEDVRSIDLMPEAVVKGAKESGCASVAYTYSEPIVFYEYMYDTSEIARREGVKNIWVTAGYINQKPLERLCGVIDAANVDLKSFSDDIYQRLNGVHLQPVLETLKTLHKKGVWFEVTNLVVPSWTDDLDMIGEMVEWIVKNIGVDYPLHFSRCYPMYQLTKISPTPVSTLEKAKKIAQDAGLNYVYIGNVPGRGYENTVCPGCGEYAVKRRGYEILENNIVDEKCGKCGEKIAGVWS